MERFCSLSDNGCTVFRLGPNYMVIAWLPSFPSASVTSSAVPMINFDWFHILKATQLLIHPDRILRLVHILCGSDS